MGDGSAATRRIEAKKPPATEVAGGGDVQQIQSSYIASSGIPPKQIARQSNQGFKRLATINPTAGSDIARQRGPPVSQPPKIALTFRQDRASHVAALAGQYQSGKYRPDSQATSSAIVSDALNAGGKAAGVK